tara:strand:+ start:127 stop:1428 length:1302 start_codon:yes stop_codon:yes gene_type:complete
MARNKLTDLSATASENTDLQSVNVAEGMSPGGVNNALRALAAMLGDAFALTTPGTKLQTVQAQKFHVAADTDRLQLGTTKPTEVTHDNTNFKTTIDATRSLTVKVGEPSDSGTSAFELIETDATLGELSVLKQSNAGGLQVGNADLNAQRTANGDTTAAMTVTGTVNATAFVGDGSGLTGVSTGESTLPVGIIAMWSGTIANIPSGWALCDGQSGRPDLQDRFILGARASGSPAINTTGGAHDRTLTESQMPQHNHVAGSIGQNHRHGVEDVELPEHTHSAGTLTVSSHNHGITGGNHRHDVSVNGHNHAITAGKVNYLVPLSNYQISSYQLLINAGNGPQGSHVFNSTVVAPDGRTDFEDPVPSNTANSAPGLSGNTGALTGSPTFGAGQQTSVPTGGGTLSGTTGNAGSGGPFDNRPAYYALAFIIFEGTS